MNLTMAMVETITPLIYPGISKRVDRALSVVLILL